MEVNGSDATDMDLRGNRGGQLKVEISLGIENECRIGTLHHEPGREG